MIKKNLGQKIATLRQKNCLTQQQLADSLFIDSRTISKWEKNLSTPNIYYIEEIAKVLNVNSTYFLKVNSIPKPRKSQTFFLELANIDVSITIPILKIGSWDLKFGITLQLSSKNKHN